MSFLCLSVFRVFSIFRGLNFRSFFNAASLILLGLWLAGCETMPPRPPARASATPTPAAPAPPPALTTVHVPEEFSIAPPAPIYDTPEIVVPPTALLDTNTPAPRVASSWPTNWINVWIPLETWGRFNGGSQLSQHGSAYAPEVDVKTSNAIVSLKIGSKVARFNGLEFWMAHPPQIIKGLAYVQSLDAQKNLQPLVTPFGYELKTNRSIVLDPGHGGKDSGTRSSVSSNFEKEYTLDWALRLQRLLIANGWHVILTRSNDVDISLGERVAIADRAKADLFISLHFNSGTPNHELAGVETYCLTPTGLPSSLVRTYEDDVKQIFPNNAFDEQNYQIAYRLHRELVQSAGATDRGIRRARFMSVLRGQNRPAVLIEGGYLSNPQEARKVASAAYRQALAEAVARGLETIGYASAPKPESSAKL